MISRYELERQRSLAKQDEERVRVIDKGREMWTKAQNLLQKRGQDLRGTGYEKLNDNDFHSFDWFDESFSIRYLVDEVDLSEEEPTTVVIKSFKRQGKMVDAPIVHIWAKDMYYFVELFNNVGPLRFYRVSDLSEKPVFDCANGDDMADIKLLELYDHVLDRLGAKLRVRSTFRIILFGRSRLRIFSLLFLLSALQFSCR